MESNGGEQDDWLYFARMNGVEVNKEGGYYFRGKQYGMEKKRTVAETYIHYKQLDGGGQVSQR
jgi:hypothetical protein